MKITRERIVFIGLLVVAVGGFGFDRLTASTSAAEVPSDVEIPMATVAHATVARTSATQNLSHQLVALNVQLNTARPIDPFVIQTNVVGGAGGPNFRTSHRLTAISRSTRSAAAIVNNKVLTVGDQLDGYQLTEINDRSATFRCDDVAAILLIDASARNAR